MPLDLGLCPSEDQVQLAVCNKLAGWPAPAYPFGEDAPENTITGYYPGQLYARTSTSKLYAFFGTAGTAVGWQILN